MHSGNGSTGRCRPRRLHQTGLPNQPRGLALLAALAAVALAGLAGAAAVQVGAQVARKEAEDELLRVGQDFQKALRSYIDSTPGQAALGPRNLEDLLRDPRLPGLRRHLRHIPIDPLTGKAQWGQLRSPDGQIVGVYSLAEGKPVKQAGFEPPLARLAQAASYQAWVFGPSVPVAPKVQNPGLGTTPPPEPSAPWVPVPLLPVVPPRAR